MYILVLHALNRRARKTKSVIEHELMFPRIDQGNNYHVHNARFPLMKYQKRINYDAIIITSTFIDLLTNNKNNQKIYSDYEFLSKSDAFKVAFPQDDYWLSDVRDKWYCDMNINIVFPVCQRKHWEFLYPKYFSIGQLRQGYTGYVHERHFQLNQKSKSVKDRRMDVVYRATKTPLFPNRLGYLKGNLGSNFKHLCEESHSLLRIDVEGKPKTRNQWAKLLSESRTVLGSPSGSSTLVSNWNVAELLRSIKGLTELNIEQELSRQIPLATLGKDFTAISPRNIEAAATGTVQVLVEGDYGDLLTPFVDYIPFDFRIESFPQLERQIMDSEKIEQISRNCWRTISNKVELLAINHVNLVIDLISTENKSISLGERIKQNSLPEWYLSKMLSLVNQFFISTCDLFRMILPTLKISLRKVTIK